MNLLQAIEQYESRASGRGSLADERQSALDHYMGEPYGDEVEGRSHVVMRDVADTIEWIKPSLLKIFCAGDEVVRFDPVGPEDEDAAQQETDYCNHIVMQKNQGFVIFHDWFHDALLQKNGYIVVRAATKTESAREQFAGLTPDEFALVLSTENTEVVEHTEHPDGTHDVVLKQIREYACLDISNIPPERVIIDETWGGLTLEGCPFVEVIDTKTISQLRNEGYDVPDDISDEAKYNEDDGAKDQRDLLSDQREDGEDERTGPDRRVKVRECWILHDADDDGISELMHVVVVGTTILLEEEDDIIPVAAISPIRMPHEHVGLSIDDIVHDLQRIRTVLMRGVLDETYMSMHPQTYVDVNRVNLDDMLVTRVGGIRRVQGSPSDAVYESIRPSQAQATLGAIEYIDTVRENRTGVTKYNQGLDSNTLNKTASGMNQIMSASQQRIELIARLFAETGVKALMLIVHAMSIKHGRQPEMLKLRGQWIPIDPRGWKSRKDLTVSVGIGTGNKDQMLQHLFLILQEQKQGLAIGLAKPQNLYNTLKRITQNAGFKQAEEFWQDVGNMPPAPSQPPPEIQKVQMELQADAQKFQAQTKLELQKIQMASEAKMAEVQANLSLQATNDQRDFEREQQKAVFDAQLEQQKRENEKAIAQMNAELEKYKADLDANVKLAIAGVQGLPPAVESAIAPLGQSIETLMSQMVGLMEHLNTDREIVRDPQTGRAVGLKRATMQ